MKYFCVSDLHGCFTPFMEALEKAGFDKDNVDHTLICVGDLFDRGSQSYEIYKYIKKLKRKIILAGNHDTRLLHVLRSGLLESADYWNGVPATLLSFARGYMLDNIDADRWEILLEAAERRYAEDFDALAQQLAKQEDFISFLHDMPYFYELENYIFTHAWLPTAAQKVSLAEITKKEWEGALWSHTINCLADIDKTGPISLKTLVIGHWHNWRLREYVQATTFGEFEVLNRSDLHETYEMKYYNVVGLDGAVNITDLVNVYIIEE